MGGASHDFAVTADDWDEAPCGLLILDEHDRVRAANAGFLRRTGYDLRDVIAKAFWNELLATGSRVFYQTQLAPVLELDGVLDEVMVDLRTADSRRVPALLNARRISDHTGRRVATRIALMGVPDRRVYENELRRARDEAEQARREADRARSVDAVARRRLEFQGSANTALADSSDVTTALTRVTRVLVENFADWCVTYALEPDDPEIVRWTSAHADPA